MTRATKAQIGGAAVPEEKPPAIVTVTFHTRPSYVEVYQISLETCSKVRVTNNRGALEFPPYLVEKDLPLQVCFSVRTWTGVYPDWTVPDAQKWKEWKSQGFSVNVTEEQARRDEKVPGQGTQELPLPWHVAFQAWTLAHPWMTLILLLLAAAAPLLAGRGKAFLRGVVGQVDPGLETSAVEDYRMGAKLGEGGMGEVWAATSPDGTPCALKFVRAELAKETIFRERFEREVDNCKRLNHPYLLKFYGYGVSSEGSLFMSCELLHGQTLKQAIASRAYDPPQLASLVIDQMGDALGYLHELGLVHRDVKPDNIFLCDNGDLKLMDMGLLRPESLTASGQGHLTRTGQVLGTPAYMPPEQLVTNQNPTGAADQYSLGIILYEVMVGERPFTQPEPMVLAFQHTHVAPEPPSARDHRITAETEAAILRMLAKKPEERFSSMAEAQKALEHLRFCTWKDTGDETSHGTLKNPADS